MQQPQSWQPENAVSFDADGQRVADRNLWLLAGGLFCAFAVWMYWSVMTVLMLQLEFPHSTVELFSLIALAGLSGGTLRITLGFLVPAKGSAHFLLLAIFLLIFPALGTGILMRPNTPLWVLQLLAVATGLGGGCFSAFVVGVSNLFPRNQRGMALGLGTGLGHLGIAACQIALPLVATWSVLGGLSGEPLVLSVAGSTWLGAIRAGEALWIQHVGYLWLLFLFLVVPLTWLGLRRARTERAGGVLGRMGLALFVGLLTAALAVWLILPLNDFGAGLELSHELVLVLLVTSALMLMRLLPGSLGRNLDRSYVVFNNKHTWVMGVLCAMSAGSFLGFSAALPLTLQLVFGYTYDSADVRVPNINAPGIFTYVWMGPLIAVLMRPVGQWMTMRLGGARVTQLCAFSMMVSSAGAAYYLALAYRSPQPEHYFLPCLLLFFMLFAAAGAGYASVLHSATRLFPAGQFMPVSIWMSAIAAYGVFYIPSLLGEQLERGTPEQAMVGFGLFYAVCLLLNGWFYLRRDSEFYNP